MASQKFSKGYGFGTAPVYLAGISTILGAILFLRFGYAVAHAGILGSIIIIIIGHAITIPTALAIAEIATNRKVEGGGEYYMISRSFGSMLGGTIGISLYLSQAISIAFYIIAFSEAFTPLFGFIANKTGIKPHITMISLPATIILLLLIMKKGAKLGVTVLWMVVSILGISLFSFFIGSNDSVNNTFDILAKIDEPDDFFAIFAIVFPAFTGMTAGVGLSGDLKNPRKSIPLGTILATLTGMIVYIFVVLKLGYSLSPNELANDQFAMSRIAIWGPIIPIGLAAATLSSAIGSILIAPRTLQALARDNIFPTTTINEYLGKGKGETNDPLNAMLVTSIIVFIFVSMGSVDFVAKVISMFFLITYGTLCLVSFLEHFAGNPSYRPSFKSRWYLSLIGALACFIMMFQMAPIYAMLAVISMIFIYMGIKRSNTDEYGLSDMVKGVLFQLTRRLKIISQRQYDNTNALNWRPSFIGISTSTFTRLAPFDLMRWLSHYYGFGTFLHYIKGSLNKETSIEAKEKLSQLIKMGDESHSVIYVDTIISPSFKTAIAQLIQIPGLSGMDNNSILFEFNQDITDELPDIIEGCQFASILDYNLCVLRSSERHFGYKKKIHIWLTPGDYRNANFMILLSYIILGHPEWKEGEIEIFAAFEKKELNKEVSKLNDLIDKGRIPISRNNVNKVEWNKRSKTYEYLVSEHSESADLVIMGFSLDKVVSESGNFFKKFTNIKDILFVRAGQKIIISDK